jgi:hypothetical protein
MLAGTASASSAAIALATLSQVSERMPPAMTIAVAPPGRSSWRPGLRP